MLSLLNNNFQYALKVFSLSWATDVFVLLKSIQCVLCFSILKSPYIRLQDPLYLMTCCGDSCTADTSPFMCLDLGRRRSERRCWPRDRDRYTKSRPEVGPASSCLAHSRNHRRRHPAPAKPEGPQFAHLQPGHQ